jgi:hypothetical protein
MYVVSGILTTIRTKINLLCYGAMLFGTFLKNFSHEYILPWTWN